MLSLKMIKDVAVSLCYRCLKPVWQLRKRSALVRRKPVPPMPGELDPRSPYYLNPAEYGCKPGVITWEFLNAIYYQAFPEEQLSK